VHVDNALGERLAGEHLWALGHRRLGVVQIPYGTCAEKRLEALRGVWAGHGEELADNVVVSVDSADHRLVAPAVRRLMTSDAAPTALFCNSDWLASVVLRVLREMGLGVPEDVSVVGFDDAHYAQLLSPPLTTVRQPFPELGALAVELLLEQAGFRVAQAEVGCVSTPPGYVDHQDPPGGRQDIQGITVTVYVSVGDQAVLPELLRVPLEEARQRIAQAGLVLRWEQPQTQANMPPGVDIDSLGRPGQVISYIVTYGGRSYNSGERRAGDKVPCGATIDVGYYATSP
jgi:hypothetical protein